MRHKIRSARHKNPRESNEVKQSELQELRKENQKLKREVSRFRKEFSKYSTSFNEKEEAEESLGKKENKVELSQCPECKQNGLKTINLGVKILLVCTHCKWRKAK